MILERVFIFLAIIPLVYACSSNSEFIHDPDVMLEIESATEIRVQSDSLNFNFDSILKCNNYTFIVLEEYQYLVIDQNINKDIVPGEQPDFWFEDRRNSNVEITTDYCSDIKISFIDSTGRELNNKVLKVNPTNTTITFLNLENSIQISIDPNAFEGSQKNLKIKKDFFMKKEKLTR